MSTPFSDPLPAIETLRRDTHLLGRPVSVTVTDIDMPFWSMVKFMVKWSVASVPALLILVIGGVLVAAFLQTVLKTT